MGIRTRHRRSGQRRPAGEKAKGPRLRARLHLDSLAHGGDAVGRDDGRVWFIPYGAPEDVVLAEAVEEKKSYVRGRILEVVSPGPGRTPARCAHFGTCGGCQWQHLSYAAQLTEKGRILRGALRRLTDVEIPDPEGSPDAYGYRARADLHVEARGEARTIGFRRARSHEIVEPEECPILDPLLAETVQQLRRLVKAIPGASPGRYQLHAGEEEVSLSVETEPGEAGGAVRWLRRVVGEIPALGGVYARDPRGALLVVREGRVRRDGLGHRPGVFAQAHRGLSARLDQSVLEFSAPAGRRVLELYAGAGRFTVPLAQSGARVTAVEGDPFAVRDNRDNLEEAGVTAEVLAGSVAKIAAALHAEGRVFDVIVLDPPRRGALEVLEWLGALAPQHIVYVSCDPMTLARDVQRLAGFGYAATVVRSFDLFPQTFHLETVCLLEAHGPLVTLVRS